MPYVNNIVKKLVENQLARPEARAQGSFGVVPAQLVQNTADRVPPQSQQQAENDDIFAQRLRRVQQERADYEQRARAYDRTYGSGRYAYERGDRDRVVGSRPADAILLRAQQVAQEADRFKQTGKFFPDRFTPDYQKYYKYQLAAPDPELYKVYGDDYAKQYMQRHKHWLSDEQFKRLTPENYQDVLNVLYVPDMFRHVETKYPDVETPYKRGKRLGKWSTPQEYTDFLNRASELKAEAEKGGFLKQHPWLPVAAVAGLGLGAAMLGAGEAGATASGLGASADTGAAGAIGAGTDVGATGLGAAGGVSPAAVGGAGGVTGMGAGAGAAGAGAEAAGGVPSAVENAGGWGIDQSVGFKIPDLTSPIAQDGVNMADAAWKNGLEEIASTAAKKATVPFPSISDLLTGKLSVADFTKAALKHIGKKTLKRLFAAAWGGYQLAEKNKAAQKAAVDRARQAEIRNYYDRKRALLRAAYRR